MTLALKDMTITIAAPDLLRGNEGRRELAAFYAPLLGMEIIGENWLRIAKRPGAPLRIALDMDGWSDQRPPRWPDPDFPQQLHLDILVPGVEAAGRLVTERGAMLLQDNGAWRIYADPAGHPFCLRPDRSAGDERGPGVIGTLVFDCLSPRALASFYEEFLEVNERIEDSPERVVLAVNDDRYPNFAFQHAADLIPARWPDPAYPAQLHVDYQFGDGWRAAQQRAERFGAMPLPKLADTEIYADPAGHPFCLNV